MNTTVIGNNGETTIPHHVLQDVFTRLGQERTWSDVDQDIVLPEVVAATRGGCADVYVHDDEGNLMGAGIVVLQWDCHVGDMYTMLGMYVWPEYRNQKVGAALLRTLRQFAQQDENVHWYAYAQQRRPGVFETHYKRVRQLHGQRSSNSNQAI